MTWPQELGHPAVWNKAWLETRWRFFIGLALLALSAAGIVASYDYIVGLVPLAARTDRDTVTSRQLAEQAAMIRDYRSYIWSQFIRDEFRQLAALFAVVLGTGGLLAPTRGRLFTLSLPVGRAELLWSRAGIGLLQFAGLAVTPLLLVVLWSPLAGHRYSLTDALVHGGSLFVAGSVLFSMTVLLSTVFDDVWRPPLVVLCLVAVLQVVRLLLNIPPSSSLLGVMTGESYFRSYQVPVLGLAMTAGLSAVLLHVAALNLARRDF